jgi:L-asparaginase/Glu-tRNA(Gln) amidotransferase subunit D
VVGEEVRLRTGDRGLPPELASIFGDEAPDLRVVQPFRKLSENVTPADWVTIADAVVDLVESSAVSGVVVLHGTDTAAYTAAALTFLAADAGVPVVLTGSNMPATEPDSDAPTNVRDAIVAAGSLGRGAYLSFSGIRGELSLVFAGTDVSKTAATGRAFSSVKGRPVASVVDGRLARRYQPANVPASGGQSRRIDDRVLALTLYPGIDLRLLADAALRGGTRGVVVELYPTGTGPTVQGTSSLSDFIRRCDENGIIVVTTASKLPGDGASAYETFADIREAGAVFDGGLIFEAAIAKLMWALAQTQSPGRTKQLVLEPLVQR